MVVIFFHFQRSNATGGFDMRVVQAWSKGYSGRGVVVTILDDGIEHSHPDLHQNYVSPDLSSLPFSLVCPIDFHGVKLVSVSFCLHPRETWLICIGFSHENLQKLRRIWNFCDGHWTVHWHASDFVAKFRNIFSLRVLSRKSIEPRSSLDRTRTLFIAKQTLTSELNIDGCSCSNWKWKRQLVFAKTLSHIGKLFYDL